MNASDLEIVEYTLDLMRHGVNCGKSGCPSCDKLTEIVKVIRDMIFDRDPALDLAVSGPREAVSS
jgi:hypothetical protein